MNGIVSKLEKDKYFFVIEQRYIEELQKSRFALLEDVKTVNIGNDMAVTLSIGIGMNGAAIRMAWMHGDIRMYFDKFELIPFIILFISVFVQSAAEEMICRGFIYQRVLRTYRGRFWLAVIINSVFFGMIHLGNNGISAMAVVDLVVTGLLFSAMVYYFDSLWMAMAVHTGWNFTQSILAGLPNSGNVVPYRL